MSADSDPERAGMARAVKTFGLDEDETLHLVATTAMGESRDIGQVHRAGELAVVKTDQLLSASRTTEPVDESEQLDVEELSIVGDTVTIEPNEDSPPSVVLDTDGPGGPISSFSYPGVYGLLYVPFEE